MELNINSPAYFTNHYGVDDEVYRYCQNLHNYFKTKEYSETLTIIGITPIVAPKEVYNQGLWKEKVQIVSLGTCAMIDVRMDFESYYNADSDGKIQLIEEMLIKAIKKERAHTIPDTDFNFLGGYTHGDDDDTENPCSSCRTSISQCRTAY